MTKLVLMCAVITLTLGLCGCSSQSMVEITCDEFYKLQHQGIEVAVPVGESFKVTLCANPSTGFMWGEATIDDENALAQVAREYIAPGGRRPPAPGTAGQEVWTFKALRPGQSTVSIEYGQPWEGGTKAEWTLDLTVTVK